MAKNAGRRANTEAKKKAQQEARTNKEINKRAAMDQQPVQESKQKEVLYQVKTKRDSDVIKAYITFTYRVLHPGVTGRLIFIGLLVAAPAIIVKAAWLKIACLVVGALLILLGLGMVSQQILAFVFGLLAVAISVTIPKIIRNNTNLMLVLAGIITGGVMSSVLGVMKFVADEETQLSTIIYWQMGSVASVKTDTLLAVLPVFAVGSVILLLLSWQLNIIAIGESEARTLGVNLKLIRTLTIAVASMMTASAVCISGTIGWIGLVIPHLGRLLVGSDNTKMLPCAMLMGGLFLLLIDTVARTATALEIPLSILTGVIGAPIYAWLLWKQKAKVT